MVGSPDFGIHGAVDSLRLVILAQNVDDGLITDSWMARRRRMLRVIFGLRRAGRCTGDDSVLVGFDIVKGEEFVAHVGISLSGGIERGLHGSSERNWAIVFVTRLGGVILIVSIGSGNDDVEVL